MNTKILHLSHTDILHDSRILKSMKAAEERGYKVFGIGVRLNERSNASTYFDQEKVVSLELFFKKLSFLPKVVRYSLLYLELFLRSLLLAIRKKPDILHCNDSIILPVGIIIKIFFKTALIYDAHELESNRNGLNRLFAFVVINMERMLWPFIDGLIVVSPSIQNWYHKNVGAKMSTVVLNSPAYKSHSISPNIDTDDYFRLKYAIAADIKIFLYIGIFCKGRGIDLILESFKSERVESHVVFLGYGELLNDLKSASLTCEKIHIHDPIPHEQVTLIAKSADIGLCLIENISLSDYLSLPNKLFEYSFSGLPVLASDFPDIASFVNKYKVGKVTQLDTQSIIESILLFESNMLNYTFSIDSLSPVSWPTQELILLNFYKQILIHKG